MLQTSTGTPVPATVTGTGTTPKLFSSVANVPGSLRLSGQPFTARVAGVINAGVNTNVQLSVYANYPATQVANSVANITSASMTNNVATYNGANTYVVGQYVTVANVVNSSLNGTVGPLISANATAFTANIVNGAVLAIANIANAAQTATSQLAAQPLYVGVVSPSLLLNTAVPFMAEIRMFGDNSSGVLACTGNDSTVNLAAAGYAPNTQTPTAAFNGTIAPASNGLNGVAQVNFKQEPPVYLTVGYAFGSSNANNTATLDTFYIEQ